MVVMSALRVVRKQLQDHVDLVPLAIILGSTGVFSCAAMLYTSLSKEDVVYNRWWNPMPWMHIDPTKRQQVVFHFLKSEKEIWQRDQPLESLRKEIYSDKRYTTRVDPEDHH